MIINCSCGNEEGEDLGKIFDGQKTSQIIKCTKCFSQTQKTINEES